MIISLVILYLMLAIVLYKIYYRVEKLWTWHKYNFNKEEGQKFREFIEEE